MDNNEEILAATGTTVLLAAALAATALFATPILSAMGFQPDEIRILLVTGLFALIICTFILDSTYCIVKSMTQKAFAIITGAE